MAASTETINAVEKATKDYKYGFVTEIEDGRLWVFKKDSKELEEFKKHGEPAKQFSNIGAGPNGMTVKSADQATLDEYLKAYKNQ